MGRSASDDGHHRRGVSSQEAMKRHASNPPLKQPHVAHRRLSCHVNARFLRYSFFFFFFFFFFFSPLTCFDKHNSFIPRQAGIGRMAVLHSMKPAAARFPREMRAIGRRLADHGGCGGCLRSRFVFLSNRFLWYSGRRRLVGMIPHGKHGFQGFNSENSVRECRSQHAGRVLDHLGIHERRSLRGLSLPGAVFARL
jgi:hypothetical protein